MLTTKYEDLPPLPKSIRSHLVLLYDPENYEIGSGILIKIKEYVFILTTSHVLFNNLHINLGSRWQETTLTIVDKWINKDLDIGFVRLNPFELEILKTNEVKTFEIGKKKQNCNSIKPKK